MAKHFLAGALVLLLLVASPARARSDLPSFLPALKESPATLTGAQKEELHHYFLQGRKTLGIFCLSAEPCSGISEKEALYTRFFRSGLSRTPDGDGLLPENMAYARQASAYFSEPDYVCRHPLTAAVLEALWQKPASDSDCAREQPFMLDGENAGRQIFMLDPGRVAEVHLLFAGASGTTMSRFGHVALRLVVCAPGRSQVDMSCAEDVEAHLVMGFRAGIDDPDVSLWKGVTGAYGLRLYADPFMKVYGEYTISELRPLSSLPLRLSAQERELFVRALAEVHWSYRRKYRFFTQNCASELAWLLQVMSALSDARPAWLGESTVRPDRLFAQALASPAFSGQELDDLAQAERNGFHFPASGPYYQLALDTLLQRSGTDGGVRTFRDFRELDATTRRQQFYEPAFTATLPLQDDAPGPSRVRTAHAALVLEAWLERRARRALLSSLGRHYLGVTKLLLQQTEFFSLAERAMLERCLAGFRTEDQAAYLPDGVPAHPQLPVSGCDIDAPEFRAALARLYAIAPLAGDQQRQLAELQATVNNVNWILPQTGMLLQAGSSTVRH